MRSCKKRAEILLLFFALPVMSAAQPGESTPDSSEARAAETLVALGRQVHKTSLDCSHFVNFLFAEVGLYYDYQPSRVLYQGTSAFKRVYRPSAGDLIVWPGHVGIVVDPDAKTFLSTLRRGVRVSSYVSSYWRRRGHPRFFHYKLPIVNLPVLQAEDLVSSDLLKKSGAE